MHIEKMKLCTCFCLNFLPVTPYYGGKGRRGREEGGSGLLNKNVNFEISKK